MSSVLTVEDIHFSYPGKTVLDGVSFSVQPGSILCLMGPNGCGKTTLIDIIMGIKTPDAGSVHLMGQDIRNLKRHQIARHAAFVPQLHTITFPYSVKEVVLMGRTAYTGIFGAPSAEDTDAALAALEKVGLGAYADKPYNMLSGGEIKLVLLARALGQHTPLILMDEPTAHLDFRNELIFLETIVELCKHENIAIVMATHTPAHVFYFLSHGLPVTAAMIHGGRLVAHGDPDTVVTEETIAEVFGVQTRIDTVCSNGKTIKNVTLLHTL